MQDVNIKDVEPRRCDCCKVEPATRELIGKWSSFFFCDLCIGLIAADYAGRIR